jgi:eukaryotic-like serine/threonine-protein kinase
MGEVYRARDTRLDRVVAIKVLLPELVGSADLRQRFEREARTISALSHPHICALFDVGREGETEFLVMEYLEGETLADRLSKGALPLAEVIRFGIEIAAAIDEAHRHGVVHRDLKPGNIMLTRSGIKLLDFGLAKLQEVSPREVTQSTATDVQRKSLTEAGTVQGTFQYMSPEQLEGRADSRSDIFAFGAILYEMATGRRAFTGSSRATLSAAILTAEPKPVSAIAATSPPALDRIISVCLSKDPEARWQSARDVAIQLELIAATSVEEAGGSTGHGRRWRAIALTALAALIVLAAVWVVIRPHAAETQVVRFTVPPPKGESFDTEVDTNSFAISPDGRTLAFVAGQILWIRPLASLAAERLVGTEGATAPFWSPDSRFVAFFANGQLKKASIVGGAPVTLCEVDRGDHAGSWNQKGGILFSDLIGTEVYRIGTIGQPPVAILKASPAERRIHWTSFLPDGKRFFYLSQARDSGQWSLRVAPLDGGPSRLIMDLASHVQYTPDGYLLYVRDGALLAQRFDLDRLTVSGEAAVIASHVSYFFSNTRAEFSVSDNGVLAYQDGQDSSRLVWINRQGHEVQQVGPAADYRNLRLSPQSDRIAVGIDDPQLGTPDLWIHDLVRDVRSRFTTEPGSENQAQWSPDGKEIVYNADQGGLPHLFLKAADGSGTERALGKAGNFQSPTDWFPDGRSILFEQNDFRTVTNQWILPLATGKPYPFLPSAFYEGAGHVSPDGKWIAFNSRESGHMQVYLAAFPSGGKLLVSRSGGYAPRWRRDGKELYYLTFDGDLVSVPIRDGNPIEIGSPAALFRIHDPGWKDYDVAPDGQRFLAIVLDSTEASSPIKIAVNWSRDIEKQ